MNIYQTKDFFVIWKPNGISTTVWQMHNFLEIILNQKDKSQIISDLYEKYQNTYVDKPNELGLVNRLDNGTGWCLRFAKDTQVYNDYKIAKNQNKSKKMYIANVFGKVEDFDIYMPIWHHYSDSARMTADALLSKKLIPCQTNFKLLKYNKDDDISTLEIKINEGVRHQIRVHLAQKNIYIVGENIYTTKWFRKKLHENKLWQNTDKYMFSELDWFKGFGSELSIIEENDIYLDNFLYNRDFVVYHLWSTSLEL